MGIKLKPEDWKKEKLGNVVEFEKTSGPAKGDYISDEKTEEFKYDYLVSGKEKKYTNLKTSNPTFDGEYISIGDGGGFNIFYENGKFGASGHNFVFSVKEDISLKNKFLYYNLLFLGDKIDNLYSGIGLRNLSKENLKNIEILLLPLETQQQIVSYLDQQWEKIQSMEENLEKYANEVKKLEESILDGVFGEMKEKYKEVSIEGDKESSNENIAFINPKKDEYDKNKLNKIGNNELVTFIPMDAVSENGYISYTEKKKYKNAQKGYTYFREGDIVMAKVTPSMENKKSAIVEKTLNGFGFGTTEFHVIRPNKEKIDTKYIFYFIRTKKFLNNCKDNFTGATGLKRVPADYIRNYKLPLPPLETQHQIVYYLDKQFSHINRLKKNIEKQQENIDYLKKALLNEIFDVVDEEELKE